MHESGEYSKFKYMINTKVSNIKVMTVPVYALFVDMV